MLVFCPCFQTISLGTIIMDVYASSAPNASGSASWSGYVTKSMYALENGLSVNGDRATDPTAYERAPDMVGAGEIVVTSFKSWRGEVDPPSPFNNEYGNRMHFGLHAYGDGTTQFKLENLSYEIHSSDPCDSLKVVSNFVGKAYNYYRWGISWGADRKKGGTDDVVYMSGNGTTLVDEIIYAGAGNAWWPKVTSELPTAQAAMDDYFAWVASEAPITVSCTYSILTYSGGDSVVVTPEPATICLLALGSLIFTRRKK
ncbi:MAG: PEP-CTERM sorting domain-containing protein [Sedimentisphaerales bacterium]